MLCVQSVTKETICMIRWKVHILFIQKRWYLRALEEAVYHCVCSGCLSSSASPFHWWDFVTIWLLTQIWRGHIFNRSPRQNTDQKCGVWHAVIWALKEKHFFSEKKSDPRKTFSPRGRLTLKRVLLRIKGSIGEKVFSICPTYSQIDWLFLILLDFLSKSRTKDGAGQLSLDS